MTAETLASRGPETARLAEAETLDQINTAQIHTYSEQADGVSLQTQETRAELMRRGVNTITISADFDTAPDEVDGICIPELGYHRPDVARLRQEMNPHLDCPDENAPKILVPGREKELLDEIYRQAYIIEQKLNQALDEKHIQVAHVRNLTSLPHLHPAAALAMHRLIQKRPDVHFVLHHHDLSWEGPAARFNYFGYPQVEELMQQVQVPDSPNTSHIAINPDTQQALAERYGIDVEYIPDGFAFEQEVESISRSRFIDILNQQLEPEEAPVRGQDLLLGMMTRIVSNKAIELAVQLTANLQDNRGWLHQQKLGPHQTEFDQDSQVVLVLPNNADAQEDYKQRIIEHAQQRNVRLIFVDNLAEQDIDFYQTYEAMDAIVYPSEHEGFGNQGIEAVWALKLLVVHHYPVFKALIDHIPHHVSLGTNDDMVKGPLSDELYLLDQEVLDQATVDLIKALQDTETVDKLQENRELLEKLCSIRRVVDQYVRIYSQTDHLTPAS